MLSLIHEFLVVRTSFIVRDHSSVRNTFQPLMQKLSRFGLGIQAPAVHPEPPIASAHVCGKNGSNPAPFN